MIDYKGRVTFIADDTVAPENEVQFLMGLLKKVFNSAPYSNLDVYLSTGRC